MRHDVDLIISGTGTDEKRLRALARCVPQVRFVGHVNDGELSELYANALAVLFCPIREDYGLVTVEAFQSGKPVVTCSDSGEPARLVADSVSGFVCRPDAQSIADRLDWLVENPNKAKEFGLNGCSGSTPVQWQSICRRLLNSLNCESEPS